MENTTMTINPDMKPNSDPNLIQNFVISYYAAICKITLLN